MLFKCGCDIDTQNIDIYNLPNCGETWNLLSAGNVKGLFQVESYLGKKWIRELRPDSIELLSALIAIIRPGVLKATDENGVSMTELFCKRRHGEKYEPIDEAIREILEPTYGIIVMQEAAIKISQVLCDFDLKEADELRRGMGKKLADVMSAIRTKFVDKAVTKGLVNREKAEQIYDIIEKSNRYNFNASHAVSYGVTAYITAYLKYHFPLQFYCGWLTHHSIDQDPQKELRELVQDARQNGIEINPPSLKRPQVSTHIRDGSIYLGIGDIKGIGEKSAQKIVSKTKPGMKWIATLSTYPTKQLENMIQAGALGGPRVKMLAEVNVWSNLTDLERNFLKTQPEDNLIVLLEKYGKTKKEGGCCNTQNRVDALQSHLWFLKQPPYSMVDTPVVISKFEVDTLGVQLTCTKTDSIDPKLVNTEVQDIKNGKKNGLVAIEIEEIKIVRVKNGVNKGKQMAFCNVYDITGQIEGVIFPDQFEIYNPLLLKGNTLVVKFYSKDGKSIIFNEMWQV